MKRFSILLTASFTSLFLITGCKKEVQTETQADALETATSVIKSTEKVAGLPEKIARLRVLLPSGLAAKLTPTAAAASKLHPQNSLMVRKALKAVAPSTCDANTPVMQWLGRAVSDWNSDAIYNVNEFDLLNLPANHALFFENSSTQQYFGTNGQFTQRITKTFKDLKRFWNIQSDKIVLAAMHGNMFQDRNKLIKTYALAYGLDMQTAELLADIVLQLLDLFPEYRNGDHPFFTYNAFAFPGATVHPIGNVPSKIIMGDGFIEGLAAIGYGDVAPQAILAHEYGHQVQYQLGLVNTSTPDETRKTELLADAFAAYYLSHARGASMQWKRVRQFLQVFFNIGDCSFSDIGHHGTPAQRLAAAEWAYKVADNAQKQGHILTAQQFVKLFNAQYPKLATK